MAVQYICDKCGRDVSSTKALFRVRIGKHVYLERDDADKQDQVSNLDLCEPCAYAILRVANSVDPRPA